MSVLTEVKVGLVPLRNDYEYKVLDSTIDKVMKKIEIVAEKNMEAIYELAKVLKHRQYPQFVSAHVMSEESGYILVEAGLINGFQRNFSICSDNEYIFRNAVIICKEQIVIRDPRGPK
jgi:hypothetical protein